LGTYQDIVNLLESSVTEFAALQVVPRGTPYFQDILMTGELRFARRLGANFACINPDNQITITADADTQTTQLSVSRILDWFEVGALLSFNTTVMLELLDWDTTYNTVTIAQTLPADQSAGDALTLWATPLIVWADSLEGAQQITVASRYNLLNGDVVTFPTSTLVSSLVENLVILSQNGGASGNPDFPYLFTLTLQNPMPIALSAEQASPMYLRAYMGYYSPVVRVPVLTSSQMGPFLLDYLSSPLDAVQSYQETFSVRTLDGSDNPIIGTPSSMLTVNKNYPVLSRPIAAENILFWQVQRGSGGFISPNRYRLITDSNGWARVSTRVIPSIPSGSSWSFKVQATSSGLFRFYTDAGGFQDYQLVANQLTTVVFSTTPGSVITRIEILAAFQIPGSEVAISDSTVNGPNALSFQYGLVLQVVGQANYQCTSAIVKPYFLSLSNLTGNYDSGLTYNGGIIYG
jgi:hypothetical protein